MTHTIKLNFLSWNVRGLNEKDKRIAVRQTVLLERPHIICFQETKMSLMSDKIIKETCGRRLNQFNTLPAIGTRGGILLSWSLTNFTKLQENSGTFCISVLLKNILDNSQFWLTGTYGPSTRDGREQYYEELSSIKPTDGTPWIICGDFNITIQPEDKTNNQRTWRESIHFASLISELGLLNLSMQSRRFTWSNERENPHMARLDRFLISGEWNSIFPNSKQQALPNTSSDHCLILFTARTAFKVSKLFRFENFWLSFDDFKEMVREE